MQNLKELITNLNNMLLQGRGMEAFEKHYSENVVMQENENPPTTGKEANRRREEEFFNGLIDFRNAKVLDVAIGDNVTMVVWHFDYTHKDWGVRNYTQVSVQKWMNGKIMKEQFFYGS